MKSRRFGIDMRKQEWWNLQMSYHFPIPIAVFLHYTVVPRTSEEEGKAKGKTHYLEDTLYNVPFFNNFIFYWNITDI